MEDRFYSVSEMCVKKLLLRTKHFDTLDKFIFSIYTEIVLHFQVSTLNYKFLLILIHIEKARELFISVYIRFHTCSVLFYRQQGLYWKV